MMADDSYHQNHNQKKSHSFVEQRGDMINTSGNCQKSHRTGHTTTSETNNMGIPLTIGRNNMLNEYGAPSNYYNGDVGDFNNRDSKKNHHNQKLSSSSSYHPKSSNSNTYPHH